MPASWQFSGAVAFHLCNYYNTWWVSQDPRSLWGKKKIILVYVHIWGLCSCFNRFWVFFFGKDLWQRAEFPMKKKTYMRAECKGRYFFHLQISATFQPKSNVTLPRRCNREGGPGKFLVTGSSQISMPLSKPLRGELAIAEKLGQYKQIKSGSYSVVTQSFHSPICTVILHYPLIVTYTFHSPNMEDKHWIRLKLHRFPGCPAGRGKPFLRVLAAIYWFHGSEPACRLWNTLYFHSREEKDLWQTVGNAPNEKRRDNVTSGTGRSPPLIFSL